MWSQREVQLSVKTQPFICSQIIVVAWEEYRQSAQKGHTIQDIVSQSTLQVSEKEIEDNRYLLKTVIDMLLLCAKQEIALRGHDKTEDSRIQKFLSNNGSFVRS